MKRSSCLVLCLSVVAVLSSGRADAATEIRGTIQIGNPLTATGLGITERSAPCNEPPDPDVPAGQTQGIDGFWLRVSAFAGSAATLKALPVPITNPPRLLHDFDAYFYDAGCNLIKPPGTAGDGPKDPNAYAMGKPGIATELDYDEAGTIPGAAAWAIVSMYAGANISATLGPGTFVFTAG